MEPAIEVKDYRELVAIFTFAWIIIAMLLEVVVPRRAIQQSIGYRWFNNLSLAAVTFFLSTITKNSLLIAVAWWIDIKNIGLLQHYDVSLPIAFCIFLLVSQSLGYVIHRLMHTVPWLWKLHRVHHNDTEVDVSTAYRHHPLEILISIPVLIPVFMLLGAPVEAAIAYQLFFISVSVFCHSNIRLSPFLDRVIGYVVVTPDFHRNHHRSDQAYTDSNFGTGVPWFDYLFGTATHTPYSEQPNVELGLDYFREPRDSRLDQLLVMPFKNRHGVE